MAEAAALEAAGYISALGMAPQLSATPPFGVFHDMRWLFVYNTSWAAFAAEAGALVAFRSLLNTAVVMLAWPAGRPRPRPPPADGQRRVHRSGASARSQGRLSVVVRCKC